MLIKHLTSDHVGKDITLQWRIVHLRSSGKVAFAELRDGTGFLQCVVEPQNVGDEAFEALKTCGIESAIEISWTLAKHPKKDEYELQSTAVKVLSNSTDYPLGQKEHGVEFLFDQRHLYLRSKKQRAIQRIRDTIIHSTYDWFRDHDFIKIDAPIFTPTCAEDSTELYTVEHTNGQQMFLSQSGQLYIEAAIHGHRNVYDFGPVFRAEKSKTRRHLNELRMMDAESAFTDNEWNMKIQEELIYYIIQEVLSKNRYELELTGRDISKLEAIQLPFPRKKHADIVAELQAMGSDIQTGEDLGADDETMLMSKYDQPVFVTNYPKDIKAFYMPEDPEAPGTVKCADLLTPEGYGEVIGGSERIGDYETLKAKIVDKGYNLEDYQRYLDLRKYGGVTTSWFGFGLERLVTWICGLQHIRESIPFPRYHNRTTP